MMNRKGFTLVELLMVVIIIGILVTLAVPNYYRAIERAKGGKARSGLDVIRKAQIQYRGYNDIFSSAIADLAEFEVPADIAAGADSAGDWTYGIVGDETTFTATATRDGGEHDTLTITIDQEGAIVADGAALEWQ